MRRRHREWINSQSSNRLGSILATIALIVLLRAVPAYPVTGPIFALAVDPKTPTILYAATGSGVAKSTDGGLTWNDTALTTRERRASRDWRPRAPEGAPAPEA